MKNIKILLINPCRAFPPNTRTPTLGLPLGLLSIAAVLRKSGFEVSIFDTLISEQSRIKKIGEVIHHGVDEEEFRKTLLRESPDIVGIGTLFTAQIPGLIDAAKLTRRCLPSSVIVVGGPHFSVKNESFLKANQEIDYIISGEGENSFLELVQALSAQKPTEKIAGLTFRHKNESGDNKIRINPPSSIEELDELPLPAYELIDMDHFFNLQAQGLKNRPYDNGRSVSIITSRGCPYECIFCSVHLHMGKPIRTYSVENVLAHIDNLVTNYGVEHFEFEDDNLTFYKKRTLMLFSELAKRKYGISWDTPNGVRFDTLKRPLLEAMKESGCNGLVVAPESGDQETILKIVKKAIKLDKMIPVAKWCKELSIPLRSFYLIGFPGETKEKIENTLEFALRMYKKYDVIPMLSIPMPLLGTELHDIVVNQSLNTKELTPANLASGRNIGLIHTKEFSPQDLDQYRKEFNQKVSRLSLRKNMNFGFFRSKIRKHGIVGVLKVVISRIKLTQMFAKSPDYGKEMEVEALGN